MRVKTRHVPDARAFGDHKAIAKMPTKVVASAFRDEIRALYTMQEGCDGTA